MSSKRILVEYAYKSPQFFAVGALTTFCRSHLHLMSNMSFVLYLHASGIHLSWRWLRVLIVWLSRSGRNSIATQQQVIVLHWFQMQPSRCAKKFSPPVYCDISLTPAFVRRSPLTYWRSTCDTDNASFIRRRRPFAQAGIAFRSIIFRISLGCLEVPQGVSWPHCALISPTY